MKIVLEEGVEIPKYESLEAAGFDLTANSIITAYNGTEEINPIALEKIKTDFKLRGYISLRGHERILFGTGVKVAVPRGFELQIRPRSGVTLKKGLIVANSPGTIDSDYRGEIGVILCNTTPYLVSVNKGDRICQGVVKSCVNVKFQEVESLDETERGEKGFGSTDVILKK